jgi:hypothetical protein
LLIPFLHHHGTQNNYILHNDTQHNNKKHNSHHQQSSALRDSASSVIMPCHVVYFYADCHYAEKTGFCSINLHSFLVTPWCSE